MDELIILEEGLEEELDLETTPEDVLDITEEPEEEISLEEEVSFVLLDYRALRHKPSINGELVIDDKPSNSTAWKRSPTRRSNP